VLKFTFPHSDMKLIIFFLGWRLASNRTASSSIPWLFRKSESCIYKTL